MITLPYQLDLEAETHTYRLNGVPVPAVTHILAERNLYIDSEYWTPEARIRGQAVHLATQLHDEGDLDEETVAEEIKPYLEGWKYFLQESRFEIRMIEQRLASERYGFAGTLDRYGLIGDTPTLVDIKTGYWQPAYELQLAAYQYLLCENGECPRKYICVTLTKHGSYRAKDLSLLDIHRAQALFLSALSLTKWKESV